MKEAPIISVVVVTYLHEKFIEESINSILAQQCNFEVEVIVANDCSPDSTNEVVESILKNNPKSYRIKYIEHRSNIGMIANFISALQQSKGKYIAICDGDDFWTDTLKLQKQIDFLEENNDFNLVGHYAKSSEGKDLGKFHIDTFQFKDIYHKNVRIPTASLVFRNNINYPDWMFKVYGGDRALIFLNAQKGKLKVLPFYGSVYRVHVGGAEHNLKKNKFNVAIRNIKEEFIYYNLLKTEHDVSIIKKRIFKNHFYIMALGIKKLHFANFFKAINSLISFNFYGKIKY